MHEKTLKRQQDLFISGRTKNIDLRINYLKKLRMWIKDNTWSIMAALRTDLNKPPFEAQATEIGVVLDELAYALRHIRSWARPRHVLSSIKNFPSHGRVYPEPYGVALLISPWNYPFMLTVSPLISAVAAGNCAIVKPSEMAPATSALIAKMCDEVFHPAHVTAIEGGREVSQALLELPFDKIFYTGGTEVGRVVMEAAAKNLTPITLELGGKSPCIVDQSANLKLAAKRIIWGKLINAGQTCVAPDYILAHESIKDRLIKEMEGEFRKQYKDPCQNTNYPKIINKRHFNRLNSLIDGENIIQIGSSDPATMQFAPTIIDGPDLDSPVMGEEIFGPILPVIPFSMPADVVKIIRANPKPLALYVFTSRKAVEKYYLRHLSFGGGCINDTVVHLSVPRLPFGGVGPSGMGSCHGKAGFDAFTHYRSVLHKSRLVDIPLRYPPYKDWALKLLQKL
ncbi:MAG: aldehyde dehydrogenase [Defluviitaleaceae bacterium]|nr:aldehyde dehydrogenase [Defluviitaleaceae bacterium]